MLEGTTEFKREDSITFIDISCNIDEKGIHYSDDAEEWFAIGEDNDELTRERNDSYDSSKNVLGKTNITGTAGAQTTEVDPKKIRGGEKLSNILYLINKYDLMGDKAKVRGMEVFLGDKQEEGSYGAWTEGAVIQVNSWGGDVTATQAPFVMNWDGAKVHGTFSTATKKFTKTTSV